MESAPQAMITHKAVIDPTSIEWELPEQSPAWLESDESGRARATYRSESARTLPKTYARRNRVN
jgi:hypothetical protein